MWRDQRWILGTVTGWMCVVGVHGIALAVEPDTRVGQAVRSTSGNIVWLDVQRGKLQLNTETPEGFRRVTEYSITPHDTRVTDPLDKTFLTLKDLQTGQRVTVQSVNQRETQLAQQITIEPAPTTVVVMPAVPQLQSTTGELQAIDAPSGTFVILQDPYGSSDAQRRAMSFVFDPKQIIVMQTPSPQPVQLELQPGDHVHVQFEARNGQPWARAITRLSAAPLTTMIGPQATAAPPSIAEFQLAMRKLWQDQSAYTRHYLVSAMSGLPDETAVSQRWMRTQNELGQSIAPYYGDERAARFATLLREQVQIAAEAVQASKLNQAASLTAAQRRWNDNANQLATFLAQANPQWNLREIADMLARHVDLTASQVMARARRDWAADLDFYDRDRLQVLMLADALSTGITTQFPEHFRPLSGQPQTGIGSERGGA